MFDAFAFQVKMPKKFRGENSKAVEARARKVAQKEAENERKQREAEDEYWKEDDKHVLKKLQRKVHVQTCMNVRPKPVYNVHVFGFHTLLFAVELASICCLQLSVETC